MYRISLRCWSAKSQFGSHLSYSGFCDNWTANQCTDIQDTLFSVVKMILVCTLNELNSGIPEILTKSQSLLFISYSTTPG